MLNPAPNYSRNRCIATSMFKENTWDLVFSATWGRSLILISQWLNELSKSSAPQIERENKIQTNFKTKRSRCNDFRFKKFNNPLCFVVLVVLFMLVYAFGFYRKFLQYHLIGWFHILFYLNLLTCYTLTMDVGFRPK